MLPPVSPSLSRIEIVFPGVERASTRYRAWPRLPKTTVKFRAGPCRALQRVIETSRMRRRHFRFLQAGDDKTARLDYRDKVFSLTTRPFNANDSA